jgi:NTE family protein
VSAGELRNLIEAAIPDMTFIEAHEKTGRYVNVSVAPSQMHQRSRLLNAITSPNALIREAVLASCSIPGVFPPVTLAARDEEGKRTPYVPSRTWIDGSITNDLPAQRLSRMYGVNHFISSQANPMGRWALQDPNAEHNLAMQVQLIYQRAAREWIRASYPFVMQQLRDIYPLNMWARLLYSVATQEYTADITILPKNRIVDPSKLLAPLTNEETWKLVREGEQATWPKLEMIRNCTAISRTIEAVLSRLEARIGETSIKPKTRRRNAA